jgi:protein involved in polysaccharide export with SLBB domain
MQTMRSVYGVVSGSARLLALVLGGALLIPGSASAQLSGFPSGYPIDPNAQNPTNNNNNNNNSSDSNQAGNRAAQSQAAVPPTIEMERYQADRIVDYSALAARANDRQADQPPAGDRIPLVVRPPKPSEFEEFVSQMVDKPLRRFGANLLVPGARGFTAPPTTTVPPDYRLNPGDELLIGFTGSVEASDLRLTIDSEGRIFIPRVGAVNVAGVRYGDVQALIARAVSRQYRDFRVAVSVGKLHGITVYVTGFAATPGSYTVSSLSTLVDAVLAAGGPSAGGSFRSIQVRRDGRLISDFDLYDLLLKGDKSADVLLQNGDVIFIAPAGPQVAVIGSVNVEAIYEARVNETLYDMLLYAGGINTVAENSRLLVFNPLGHVGWQQLSASDVQNRVASRGEIVRVLSGVGIAQPLYSQPALVTVSGEVANPGRYYVQPGTPMSAVIAQAGGLTAQAFPFGAVFTRESVRQTQRASYERALRDLQLSLTTQPLVSATQNYQIQPARLDAVRFVVQLLQARQPDGRLVLNVQPADRALPGDMVVENNDTIYVPPQPVTVGVFGAVPSPASFQYRRGETIGAYLRRAGGVQKLGDKGEIFVVRANGTLLAERRGLFKSSILNQPSLPGDLIFVPVDSDRGEFWARVRDISGLLFPAIIAGAAVTK